MTRSRSLTPPCCALVLAILAALLGPVADRAAAFDHRAAPSLAAPDASRPSGAPSAAAVPAALGAPVACDALWSTGFPREGTGLTDCVEYAHEHLNGADYRVYFPAEWDLTLGQGWGANYLPHVMNAVRRSVEVYGPMGTMASASLVFSPLPAASGDALQDANLVTYLSDEPCAIVIYETNNQLSAEQFEQVVAHEMFHCFQEWNFAPQREAGATDWWVEGTAHYFSNVAYPNVNFEWGWIPSFDAKSAATPITQFTYENFLFFQYLANTLGDGGVLALLHSLPSEGDEAEQLAALAAFTNMDTIFQEFAQAYLDAKIRDTGGADIPVDPTWGDARQIAGTASSNVKVAPFTIHRGLLSFAEKARFDNSATERDGPSRYAFKPAEAKEWGALPATIDCDEPRLYKAAVTGTQIDTPTPRLEISYVASETDCEPAMKDACLLGTWTVTDATMFLNSMTAGAATPITYGGVEGLLTITFDGERITWAGEDVAITGTAVASGMTVETTVFMEGSMTAFYMITGEGTLAWGGADPSLMAVSVNATLDGADLGTTVIDPADLAALGDSGSYAYACDGDVLALSLETADGPSDPIVLER